MEWKDIIKQARLEIGLTQEEMAEKTKIPVSTIRNWEQGGRDTPGWAQRLVLKELEEFKND